MLSARLAFVACISCAWITACSGGGNSSSNSNSNSGSGSGNAPVIEPISKNLNEPAKYLYFSDFKTNGQERRLHSYSLDAEQGQALHQVSSSRYAGVVYLSQIVMNENHFEAKKSNVLLLDEGRFYKIHPVTNQKTQVSSESGAFAYCGRIDAYSQVVLPNGSVIPGYVFYQLPGADAGCNTGDDLYRYISLDTSTEQAPSEVPESVYEDPEVIHDRNWDIKGFLASEESELVVYNAGFTERTVVYQSDTPIEDVELSSFPGSDFHLLRLGNAYYRVMTEHLTQVNGLALSDKVFETQEPIHDWAGDATSSYFVAGHEIKHINQQGVITTFYAISEADQIESGDYGLEMAGDYLLLSGRGKGLFRVSSISKNTGESHLLWITSDPGFINDNPIYSRGHLYLNLTRQGEFGVEYLATVIKTDATGKTEYPNSLWVYGFNALTEQGTDMEIYLLDAQAQETGQLGGGLLYTLNQETRNFGVRLGIAPPSTSHLGVADCVESRCLLVIATQDEPGTNVYYIDGEEVDSLSQLTATPEHIEQVLMF